jgi:hypothetical protein
MTTQMRKSINALLVLLLAACEFAAARATLPVEIPDYSNASSEATEITPSATVLPQPTETVGPTPTEETPLLFAVIGDFGQTGYSEFNVAEMIDSWHVDFIVTTGDDNYPDGEASTIDENIGQYYHRYIGDYKGDYNRRSETNRFFPALGNHDWSLGNIDPYLDYFTLPGNERYYDVAIPPVHLFILDSDPNEPDGVGVSSVQAAWLKDALVASTETWNIVMMHHPPYSSSLHGSSDWMQWPYKEWGADVVLSGHDHVYERFVVDNLLYLTDGLGGQLARYDFYNILPQSQFRYNDTWGALRVTATAQAITFEFININGELIDSVTLNAND